MHAIHHVQAIVLKSTIIGEANKRVWLFTEEFGLIVAVVQGVRKVGAKLQSHITDYAFIKADLIKGREVWRLINARTIDTPVSGNIRNPLARVYVRTLSLLVRFLIEEGSHTEIFEHIKDLSKIFSGEYDAKTVDAISLWKILVLLGYIAPSPEETFLITEPFPEVALKTTENQRKKLVEEAKVAIKESHL
jgi:recombinational DNA repair protein (RecF pathway)